mmetsp:Transcript_47238/g.136484  ORF Transcript_47238/g.136484 Transcript_47238/m.136484 type:complete len:223 (+) Transcript_47238:817-1485(+)
MITSAAALTVMECMIVALKPPWTSAYKRKWKAGMAGRVAVTTAQRAPYCLPSQRVGPLLRGSHARVAHHRSMLDGRTPRHTASPVTVRSASPGAAAAPHHLATTLSAFPRGIAVGRQCTKVHPPQTEPKRARHNGCNKRPSFHLPCTMGKTVLRRCLQWRPRLLNAPHCLPRMQALRLLPTGQASLVIKPSNWQSLSLCRSHSRMFRSQVHVPLQCHAWLSQ